MFSLLRRFLLSSSAPLAMNFSRRSPEEFWWKIFAEEDFQPLVALVVLCHVRGKLLVIRDPKHRQRRFATEADQVKGFVFGWENEVQAVQLPRQTTTFSLQRTLSCYSLVMALKDLCNLHKL